ncbi:BtrH N-terminal domain-containing protein [Massilia sp. BJB1822]|uniref:BtrH N-terminal domain-containing protein n=1 Tax=Massilia sp. BJB1822 TaxID=2744470 RepID=UPI001593DC48|nr:BtrH N-terminal domain-containing protein [Massilia sp. BJB1822]NVD98799.1 BtrH N-terminal domain-containing protein [Massilia sp. BJB1822]
MPEVKFKPFSGEHCESTMLVNLLRQQGIELSEEMVFGLGMGLSYIHWQSSAMPYPFIGGRVKPDLLAENLSAVLGLEFDVRETGSAARAQDNALEALEQGKLVGLKLDHYYLEYFGEKRVHFHAHYATLYKVDGENAWLVDTKDGGGGGHTSLDSLSEARSAKGPMSSKSLSLTVKDGPALEALRAQLADKLPTAFFVALAANAHTYLNPPIKNMGYKGVLKSSGSVTGWLDEIADPAESLPIIAMLMEKAGTGGGMFRKIYGRFLQQGQKLTGVAALGAAAKEFEAIAAEWTTVAELIDRAGARGSQDALAEASRLMAEISEREHAQFTALEALAREAIEQAASTAGAQA